MKSIKNGLKNKPLIGKYRMEKTNKFCFFNVVIKHSFNDRKIVNIYEISLLISVL